MEAGSPETDTITEADFKGKPGEKVKTIMCRTFYAVTAGLWLAAAAQANVTTTAKEFAAEGKIRAAVQVEREVYADRLDADFLMNTLAKKGDALKLPDEPEHLYQVVDPVPMHSYRVYTPWLNYFKQAVVFVIGTLDPERIKIARWSISLNDEAGDEIKTFAGTGQPPQAFFWDGRDSKYNPVDIGKGYVPEITLVDFYGAKVNLPQKKLYLDKFLWQSSNLLKAGFIQDSVFQKKRARFSKQGALVMRELSNLISQHSALILDIECHGQDMELSYERVEVLKKYFSKENLHLKKIRIKNVEVSGEAVFYIKAMNVRNH